MYNVIPPSRQLTLDQTLHSPPHGPDLDDPQPSRLQQRVPVFFRAFSRGEVRHHNDIQRRGLPVRVRAGNHVLVDEKLAVPGFHGGGDVRKDLPAFIVGPVMEDGVHVIGAST